MAQPYVILPVLCTMMWIANNKAGLAVGSCWSSWSRCQFPKLDVREHLLDPKTESHSLTQCCSFILISNVLFHQANAWEQKCILGTHVTKLLKNWVPVKQQSSHRTLQLRNRKYEDKLEKINSFRRRGGGGRDQKDASDWNAEGLIGLISADR